MDLSAANPEVTASYRGWARGALIVAAVLEGLDAFSNLPTLFDGTADIPGIGPSGWIATLVIALRPLLVLSALIYAATGSIRPAIVSMAAIVSATWLNDLTSVGKYGLELQGSAIASSYILFRVFACPMIALIAATLAMKNMRLTLAASLACVPTLVNVLSTIAFMTVVMVWGV